MNSTPTDVSGTDEDETYCYAHTKTPTRLRCTRCDRPICGRCAIPAQVGQHCPECVAEARRSAPKVRTVMAATAPVVMAIIAIDVVFFVLQEAAPQLLNFALTERLALYPPAIACQGEWWRLLTPMLLHGGVLHLLLNMYALYIYGPNVEEAFGRVRFVVMYVVAGFFASAVSYAFGPPIKLGVGASGAIFGILGVLLVYLYRRRATAAGAMYLRGVVLIIGLNLFIGFTVPRIDNLAHIGGLLGGIALGFGFDRPKASRGVQVAAVAGIVVLGFGLVVMGDPGFGARACRVLTSGL